MSTTTLGIRAAKDDSTALRLDNDDDASTTAALSPEELAAAVADRVLPEGEIPQALDALIESLATIRSRLGTDATRPSASIGDERFSESLLDLHASARAGCSSVAQALCRSAVLLLGTSRALIFPVSAGTVDLQPLTMFGEPDGEMGGTRQVFRKNLVQRALDSDDVVLVELTAAHGQTHDTLLSLELSAAVAHTVCLHDPVRMPIAVLYVEVAAASGRSLSAAARQWTSMLVQHAGVAWTNAMGMTSR